MASQASRLTYERGNTMRTSSKIAASLFATAALSGCYVVPVQDTQGNVQYYHYPVPPATPPISVPQGQAMPVTLHARLYPANDIANQGGMISGTVTNLRTGKGRFQLNYMGETLVGEATRLGHDATSGIASAYGVGGAYMQCEYKMNSPTQGAGTCVFSNGAKYQLHVGA
jgi:hypothetical protein